MAPPSNKYLSFSTPLITLKDRFEQKNSPTKQEKGTLPWNQHAIATDRYYHQSTNCLWNISF